MFGIGFQEIIVIFIVLILFVKPEDIPAVFRTLGKWYKKLYDAFYTFNNELNKLK